ncbi:hypothetical protein MRX96_019661 [Rhipicephalus microplus]
MNARSQQRGARGEEKRPTRRTKRTSGCMRWTARQWLDDRGLREGRAGLAGQVIKGGERGPSRKRYAGLHTPFAPHDGGRSRQAMADGHGGGGALAGRIICQSRVY